MKIQDSIFLAVLVILLIIHKPKLFVWAGVICLFLAIPLFAQWIFFTAQRLTWFSFIFFVIAVLLSIIIDSKVLKGRNK